MLCVPQGVSCPDELIAIPVQRLVRAILVAFALIGAANWYLSGPEFLSDSALSEIEPDLQRGEWVFYASGCASCHSAPDATGSEKLTLAGGRRFETQFGTFIAPNISSDPDFGIGSWTTEEFANAVIFGTSPNSQHYYPAFPYSSYSNMTPEDVVSLHAFVKTLPSSPEPSVAHEIGFPFNIRRTLGAWKLLFVNTDWVVKADLSEQQQHGRYLVEALGHCGECHTPRNALGGLDYGAWLSGAPNPSGKGRIPAISSDKLDWSEADIAEYLRSGFTPDYDSAGGEMAEVIENTSRLGDDDRAAIAAYLKFVKQSE